MPAYSRTAYSSYGKPWEPMWRNMFAARSTASARVRGGRDVNIRRQVDIAGRPSRGAPVVDMIDVKRANPARVLRSDGLGDHPAHRDADQVGVDVAERVQQPDGIAANLRVACSGVEPVHSETWSRDTVGLLDALGYVDAHLVGISMAG